jgi:predicted Rossmann fold nucleotide-binding protein DprA/Smf involved in DNA uptake
LLKMHVSLIAPIDSAYPAAIEERLQTRPPIAALGNVDLVQCRPLALFCSIKCPGDVILQTYDLIRALRDARTPMIGGFHSPMEKDCLTLLLRGCQPVIVCPARGIDGMRIPAAWREPLAKRRLLVLSQFDKKHRRITADASHTRNLFVAALADQFLVAHAAKGSKTFQLVEQLLSWKKPLWTIASPANEDLAVLGAKPLGPESISTLTGWRREYSG